MTMCVYMSLLVANLGLYREQSDAKKMTFQNNSETSLSYTLNKIKRFLR